MLYMAVTSPSMTRFYSTLEGIFSAPEHLVLQVVFTEAVEVIGTPRLLLDMQGATLKYATVIGNAAIGDTHNVNTPWNNNNELPGDFNV